MTTPAKRVSSANSSGGNASAWQCLRVAIYQWRLDPTSDMSVLSYDIYLGLRAQYKYKYLG